MRQSIITHLSFLSKLLVVGSLVFFSSCGDNEEPSKTADPCESCINGECIDDVCVCEDFYGGTACDSLIAPTKITWKNLIALDVKEESAGGPWDATAGEEAPDLYFKVYEGFHFDASQFSGLTPIYQSEVSTNWTGDTFTVEDVNLEFDWVSSGSITILLADKDGSEDQFMELGYIELEDYQEAELPYFETDDVFGTLQFPINFNIDLEFEF